MELSKNCHSKWQFFATGTLRGRHVYLPPLCLRHTIATVQTSESVRSRDPFLLTSVTGVLRFVQSFHVDRETSGSSVKDIRLNRTHRSRSCDHVRPFSCHHLPHNNQEISIQNFCVWPFDTFTTDMETCHGKAHVSCLEAVSSDFQLLHLLKLCSDTIFFITEVINRVLVSNLPLDRIRSYRSSHEESCSSLRVSVQKTWTQYGRTCEWLPQVSLDVHAYVRSGSNRGHRSAGDFSGALHGPGCSQEWIIIVFFSSDSCFENLSIFLSWTFDQDRFLSAKLVRSPYAFL